MGDQLATAAPAGNFDIEEAATTECPACHQIAVVFDYLQGFSACESCGRVAQGEDLVPQLFDESSNRPAGVFVSHKDSGLGASAAILHGAGVGRALQRSRPSDSMHKFREHLKRLADSLSLSSVMTQEAEGYIERLRPALTGNWRREELAAAATYVALRQNNSPLTLLDLSKATHTDIYTLGKFYRLAVNALGIAPPPIQPLTLLPRAIDRVMTDKSVAGKVQEDAAAMLQWIDRHLLIGSRHPIVIIAVAIVIALEMNNVAVGLEYVARRLFVSHFALFPKLQQIKDKLLSFATLLPYSSQITHKNVFSHARAIMRLTNVLQQQQQEAAAAALVATQKRLLEKEREEVGLESAQNTGIVGENDSKTRKRVRFEDGHAVDEKPRTVGEKAFAPWPLEEEDDGLGSDLDSSDSDMNVYLRSEEEVAVYREIYEALEEAQQKNGGGNLHGKRSTRKK